MYELLREDGLALMKKAVAIVFITLRNGIFLLNAQLNLIQQKLKSIYLTMPPRGGEWPYNQKD